MFNFGMSNLFDSAVSEYGIMNVGTPYPENQYVTTTPQLSQQFSMPYRQVWMTTMVHF